MEKNRKNKTSINAEEILDKKIENKKVFYKIKWENLPETDSTWEPYEKVKKFQELINEYEEKNNLGKKRLRQDTEEILKVEKKTAKKTKK
jgi:hypothetical protein